MQYIFLKTIIGTILTNFRCPQCQSMTDEQSIQVSGVSANGLDIIIHCPSCGVNTQLNAEINTMAAQMLQSDHGRKYFEEFLKQGGTLGAQVQGMQDIQDGTIRAEDIKKIEDDLNNIKSIEDLMK